AGQGVVARAAVDHQTDEGRQPVPGRDPVVAAVGVDHQALGRADVQEERGRGRTVEADPRAVSGYGKGFGAVAAVDLDGVGAGAALVEITSFAGVPDEPVVAGLAEDLVVARAAREDVAAVAAEQQ